MNNPTLQRLMVWLSYHQKGIYITLIFHLLIFIVLVSFKISKSQDNAISQILMDFSTITPDPSQLTEEEQTELRQQIAQSVTQSGIRNAQADHNADENLINRLDKNVEVYRQAAEIQQQLQETYNRSTDVPPSTSVSDNTVSSDNPLPSSPKSTGNVAVEYDIPHRQATKLPTPIYQCQTYGKVIIAVEVNAKGYVNRAAVMKQQSATDPCLQDAALKAAKLSRFNIRESQIDKGTISYFFEAQ